jgi:hypothetical protein
MRASETVKAALQVSLAFAEDLAVSRPHPLRHPSVAVFSSVRGGSRRDAREHPQAPPNTGSPGPGRAHRDRVVCHRDSVTVRVARGGPVTLRLASVRIRINATQSRTHSPVGPENPDPDPG